MPQPSDFGLSAEKYTALPPGFLQEGSADKLRWMVQTARTTPGSKILLSGKTVPEPEVTPVISFLTASWSEVSHPTLPQLPGSGVHQRCQILPTSLLFSQAASSCEILRLRSLPPSWQGPYKYTDKRTSPPHWSRREEDMPHIPSTSCQISGAAYTPCNRQIPVPCWDMPAHHRSYIFPTTQDKKSFSRWRNTEACTGSSV